MRCQRCIMLYWTRGLILRREEVLYLKDASCRDCALSSECNEELERSIWTWKATLALVLVKLKVLEGEKRMRLCCVREQVAAVADLASLWPVGQSFTECERGHKSPAGRTPDDIQELYKPARPKQTGPLCPHFPRLLPPLPVATPSRRRRQMARRGCRDICEIGQ